MSKGLADPPTRFTVPYRTRANDGGGQQQEALNHATASKDAQVIDTSSNEPDQTSGSRIQTSHQASTQ